MLSIDEADDKILVAAFKNELWKGKFIFSLYKNDPETMLEVLYRATKYMNAEDALLAQEEKPKKRESQEDTQQDQGSKKARTGDRRDERHSKPQGGRFTSSINCPSRPSLDADQRRGGPDLPWKAKGKSQQAIKGQILPLPL